MLKQMEGHIRVIEMGFPSVRFWLIATLSVHLSQDEECLRPGDASDFTFLEKLEDTVGGHAHFVTLVSHQLLSTAACTVALVLQNFSCLLALPDCEVLNMSPVHLLMNCFPAVTSWLMERPGR